MQQSVHMEKINIAGGQSGTAVEYYNNLNIFTVAVKSMCSSWNKQ